MKRKIMDDLIKWRDSSTRRPLILDGARQVGKTYILEEFGQEHFTNYIRIDFQNPPAPIAEVFDRTLNPREILHDLGQYYNTQIIPGKTLLFFDEIQDSPRALTSLKYFCEEAPEYHIVVAGSLLGVFLRSSSESPYPVGKVDHLRLEPMDFEEFVLSQSRGDVIAKALASPEEKLFEDILRGYFMDYAIVGGMPGAVAAWNESHDLSRVKAVHSGILSDYRDDFSKYTDSSTAHRLLEVFNSLPRQFAKGTDKFLYGVVREGARARDYEIAIEWLVNAGIIRRVDRVERGDKIPLSAYIDTNSFKLYFLDLGLFRTLSEIPPRAIMEKNAIFDEYNGYFAEQFVLQNLARHNLRYWTGRQAEVDFILQDDESLRIIPVEVKSGENVQAKSLRSFRDKYSPSLSVRLSLKPFQYADGLLNVPLYKIFGFDEFIAKY